VKGIVENHSGSIRVRSRPGKGTIFKLAFPIVR
jgi:signal transduction histidine kinase